MEDKNEKILSEHTADMAPGQAEELQEKIMGMTGEELAGFRNGMDPDGMGFHGQEGE